MSTKILKIEDISDTEEIRHEILSRKMSRLIVFSDVIDRYMHIRLKNNNSWLRVNTILFLRARGGKLTPGQLAMLMLRTKNSITKLINDLEADGLINRVHSNKDHRMVIIEVTSKGHEFAITNLKKLNPLEKELRACLDDDELTELVSLTRKLRLKLIEKLTGLKSIN